MADNNEKRGEVLAVDETEASAGDVSAEILDVDESEEDGVLELEDENGNTVKMAFLDLVEYEGGRYALFLPVEGLDLPDMVVVLQVVDTDEDGEVFERVDDDATVQAVFAIFKERNPDEAEPQ